MMGVPKKDYIGDICIYICICICMHTYVSNLLRNSQIRLVSGQRRHSDLSFHKLGVRLEVSLVFRLHLGSLYFDS